MLDIRDLVPFSPNFAGSNISQLTSRDITECNKYTPYSQFVTENKDIWIFENFDKGALLWNHLTGPHKKYTACTSTHHMDHVKQVSYR